MTRLIIGTPVFSAKAISSQSEIEWKAYILRGEEYGKKAAELSLNRFD
jgi:hypothetical protein